MLIGLIIFLSAMVQGVVGFGGALFAMPLLIAVIGIQTAAPFLAIMSAAITLLNVIRLREHTTPRDLIKLLIAAFAGIPVGILLLSRADAAVVTGLLGVILIAYALYSLFSRGMPTLRHPVWAYVAGFSSGILGAAFNAGGPPVVMYASAQDWSADRFRGNLQAYYLALSVVVVVGHTVGGNLTSEIWRLALLSVPALSAGLLVGVWLSRRVESATFRKLVLVFLLALGIQLLVNRP